MVSWPRVVDVVFIRFAFLGCRAKPFSGRVTEQSIENCAQMRIRFNVCSLNHLPLLFFKPVYGRLIKESARKVDSLYNAPINKACMAMVVLGSVGIATVVRR